MSIAQDVVRPMDLPSLPARLLDPKGTAGQAEGPSDEGSGARLIGYAAGFREGREAGRADGIDAGTAEGREAGRAEADVALRSLVARVDAELAVVAQQWSEAAGRLAEEAVDLALRIAAEVLGREVEALDDPGIEALRRAVRVLPTATDASDAVLHLHPTDRDAFAGDPDLPGLRVVADPDVEPGGCRLRVADADVDAGISAALDRVRQVLVP